MVWSGVMDGSGVVVGVSVGESVGVIVGVSVGVSVGVIVSDVIVGVGTIESVGVGVTVFPPVFAVVSTVLFVVVLLVSVTCCVGAGVDVSDGVGSASCARTSAGRKLADTRTNAVVMANSFDSIFNCFFFKIFIHQSLIPREGSPNGALPKDKAKKLAS